MLFRSLLTLHQRLIFFSLNSPPEPGNSGCLAEVSLGSDLEPAVHHFCFLLLDHPLPDISQCPLVVEEAELVVVSDPVSPFLLACQLGSWLEHGLAG